MAIKVQPLLSAVAANTTGSSFTLPSNNKSESIGFVITTSGTVNMTVSILAGNDNANLATVYTGAITTATSTAYSVAHGWPIIRADVSSWVSGTVTVTASY